MSVPVLNQHAAPFNNQRLGTKNGTTLGSHGCLIYCLTMIHRAWGGNLNASQIDDLFTAKGGYGKVDPITGKLVAISPAPDCNLVLWGAVPKLLPQLREVFNQRYLGPAPVAAICQRLDAGELVVLEVLWKGKTMHFVLAVGHDNGDLIVNDPETGKQQRFSSKLFGTGNAAVDIQSVRAYARTTPATKAAQPAAPKQEEPVLNFEQENKVYNIVLRRPREGGQASGRTAYRIVLDAVPELEEQRRQEKEAFNAEKSRREQAEKRVEELERQANQPVAEPTPPAEVVAAPTPTPFLELLQKINYRPTKEIPRTVLRPNFSTFDPTGKFDGLKLSVGDKFTQVAAFKDPGSGKTFVVGKGPDKRGELIGVPLEAVLKQLAGPKVDSLGKPNRVSMATHEQVSKVYGLIEKVKLALAGAKNNLKGSKS